MLNKALITKKVQEYIKDNLKSDLPSLILKGSPFEGISVQELAVQIKGAQIALKKFPLFSENDNIIYPPKLNLEQTSSQITAEYKATLLKGKSGIDLTAGLGIDTYFISQNFESFDYCEMNTDLAEIAEHNFRELKADNIQVFQTDSLERLNNNPHTYDWIYCDPARRDDKGGKVYKLEDCLPDIPSNLDLLFSKSDQILLKTSPILDLTAGLRELTCVKEIHIVAVRNEVKEILWILESNFSGTPAVKTLNFEQQNQQIFSGEFDDSQASSEYGLTENYLYEPNSSLMKSGMFNQLSQKTHTKKLHPHSHLYTSNTIVDFPGRIFEITEVLDYNPSYLKKRLKSKKANITTRNFGESVEQLRKRFKVKDGGNDYIFFTTDLNEYRKVIFCKKFTPTT
ncbi:class I SAM-dependent methyltransferase [Christiangramia aquimixticola]|uniref:class I SAM-dependent methyltransferase n=1 Tax=Christiangramia aquimixticola TaxID=1697558 RepID=UPI003AA885A8